MYKVDTKEDHIITEFIMPYKTKKWNREVIEEFEVTVCVREDK